MMNSNENKDIELACPWNVKFMVKMREKQGQYRKTDFIGNFIEVGQKSNSLLQVFKNMRTVPNFNQRQRGILSIFRNDIKPIYEDPANKQGFYIRFIVMNDQDALEKCIAQLKQLPVETQAERDKLDEQVKRTLAPVMNHCDDIINTFIFMGLSGVLQPKHGQFNGIYAHMEEGILKLDFWYDKEAKETQKKQILEMFRSLLSEINEQYTFEGLNGKKYSLLDTLQAVDMLDYGDGKKQLGKQKGK